MRGLLYKEYCIFTAQIKTWLALLLFLLFSACLQGISGPCWEGSALLL